MTDAVFGRSYLDRANRVYVFSRKDLEDPNGIFADDPAKKRMFNQKLAQYIAQGFAKVVDFP